jgi:hypothetical protein
VGLSVEVLLCGADSDGALEGVEHFAELAAFAPKNFETGGMEDLVTVGEDELGL